MLVSERIGQFFSESARGRDRLEYTEYGAGNDWLVLLPGLFLPRRIQQEWARTLADAGWHVLTLDPLGQGRSDRPPDAGRYTLQAYSDQVRELLDHVAAPRAVLAGSSWGATVALRTAQRWPDRVTGLLLEAPVLDHSRPALRTALGLAATVSRGAPHLVRAVRSSSRRIPRGLVPHWAGITLEVLNQRPQAVTAVVDGIVADGRLPQTEAARPVSDLPGTDAPALVIGHAGDPLHRFADAELVAEALPRAVLVRAESPLAWRVRSPRLHEQVAVFLDGLPHSRRRQRRVRG